MGKPLKVSLEVSTLSKTKTNNILDLLNKILVNQDKMEKLIMGIKDDLAAFAKSVDAVTNTIAANVTKVATMITDLQAQIANGTVTPTEMSAALDPVKTHLQSVSDALNAIATGGTPVIPPVEPL